MSEAPFLSDNPFFGSSCDKLEKELSKKACGTIQKAIDSAVCTSLKHSVRESVQQAITVSATNATCGTPSVLGTDFGAALEEILGNAVCATLRQAVTHDVHAALSDAISTSVQNAMRWEREMPFHVTPEALNVSLEEVTGNAACTALKQVIADSVCKALRKAIAESVVFVVRAHARRAPSSLREIQRVGTSIANAGNQYGRDANRYTSQHDPLAGLCAVVQKKVTDEVCSQLRQQTASTLCAMLKTAVRDGIRQRTGGWQNNKDAERVFGHPVAGSVLSHKTGVMIIAAIAVVAFAVAAASPNTPLHFSSTPATALSLYVQTPLSNSGSMSLSGTLTTHDGVGVGGQIVELQRQSGGTWTALGRATTQSDGSFVFDLVHRNTSTTFERAFYRSSSSTTTPQTSDRSLSPAPVLQFQQTINSSVQTAIPSNASEHVNLIAVPSHITVQPREVFTVNGSVTQKGGAIAGGLIDIERSFDNVTWSTSGTTTTDQSGHYTIAYYETEAGTAYYRTSYPPTGDTSGVVTVVSGPQPPAAAIDVISGPPYYVRTPVTVNANQSATNGSVTYSWSITGPSSGDTDIPPSNAPTATFIPNESGSYTVHLTVTNSSGSQDTADRTFAVVAQVSPSPASSTASSVALPSPSSVTPSSHPVIVVPNDSTTGSEGHLYRVVFLGSAQSAASTSEAILVNVG